MKPAFKKGNTFKNWKLLFYLGGGGNGEVWACENGNGIKAAIKLLKKIKPKAYKRFIDETTIIESNSDIDGIVKIIDKHLPKNQITEVPFYVMHLAEPAETRLKRCPIEQIIEAILQVANTLSVLHDRKIFHRDIKPANILYYNSKFALADFGLVDYPNKKDISASNEEIGAKWTMAPEMRRESSSANLKAADVYSLAKTLWILLTGRIKGFDGQYSIDSIIDLKNFYPRTYTAPLDNLLIACTDNNPERRPSIGEFTTALINWQKIQRSFHEKNVQQWLELQTKLFPVSVPSRTIWEDVDEIIKILKIICSFRDLNHLFFPNSGGLDLKDIRRSAENNCIELDFGQIHILKPYRLIFEAFNFDPEWNYFRLEAQELSMSKVYANSSNEFNDEVGFEELTELSPGNYYPYSIFADPAFYENDYNITTAMRRVRRWFRGSFVIFCKSSLYNLMPATTDGRHAKMDAVEFRTYIQKYVKALRDHRKQTSSDNKTREEGKLLTNKPKDKIEQEIVYLCGFCGDIVDANGHKLNGSLYHYSRKIINKFGYSVVKEVDGKCCLSA